MKPSLRVLVVDDEPAARRGLDRRLRTFPEIGDIQLCSDGIQAIHYLETTSFDLVFLDIQMPECDGFDVVERVGANMPPVVFVTAYDAFALQAFEVHALDYLLKPIDPKRFQEALQRVLGLLAQGGKAPFQAKLNQLRADCHTAIATRPPMPENARLMIRDKGRYFLVDLSQLLYFKVEGNYLQIVTATETYWPRETLTNLLAKLGENAFVRLSRHLAVNAQHIAQLEPLGKGAYSVKLTNGQVLQSSRHYRQSLDRFLRTFE